MTPIDRDLRPFGPLADDHPLVVNGDACCACNKPFHAGECGYMIPIGPGDDPEARTNARAGLPYKAICVIAHCACVDGEGEL